jgi:hypothetical protein
MKTVQNILAYILPFVVFLALSLLIEFLGNQIFDTKILMNKYALDLIVFIICPIAFILTGFYIAPQENRKKTIKILSIILCVSLALAISASLDVLLQCSTYITCLILTIITGVVLYKSEKGIKYVFLIALIAVAFCFAALNINYIYNNENDKIQNTGKLKDADVIESTHPTDVPAKDSTWTPVAWNERRAIEVNLTTIQRTSHEVVVWCRLTHKFQESRDQYVDNMIKNFKLNGVYLDVKKWIDYDNTYLRVKLNPEGEKVIIVSQIEYNKDGSVLHSFDLQNSKYEEADRYVAPETLLSGLNTVMFTKFKFKNNDSIYNLYIDEIDAFIAEHPNSTILDM